MNRRSLLRASIVVLASGLAGCADAIREIELSTPVPVTAINETDEARNVELVAFAEEDGRQTYDESVNVQPEQRAELGRLDTEPQRLRITLFDDDTEPEITEEASIGENTQSAEVRIVDDGLELTVNRRD